jgi:glycosyltransferase involved in cell wall biosynthesis
MLMTDRSPDSKTHEFPQKVGLLFSSEAIGGLERYSIELAIAMQRGGVARPILINLKAKTAYVDDIIANEIILYSGLLQQRFDIVGALRLLRLLRNLHLDVLIINSNRQAMWLGGVLAYFCDIPVVLIHTHEHLNRYPTTLKIISCLVNGVIAAGNQHRLALCNLQNLKPTRVFSVYPGLRLERLACDVNMQQRNSTSQIPPTIGIIAALRPEKDHENFIRAAWLVNRRVPKAKFAIVGDGPRRRSLERLVRELGLQANVHFLGWQAVGRSLFQRLTVLAVSSSSETFPAIILEAFAAGVPVVATDVGSVSEMFGFPPCGLAVRARNPVELAEGVIRLLEDEQLSRELSSRAKQRANYFSAERFCSDVLQLVRQLRQKKRRADRPNPE